MDINIALGKSDVKNYVELPGLFLYNVPRVKRPADMKACPQMDENSSKYA